MKTKIGILVLALSTSFFSLQAQRTVTTTRATSYDISDNLDLDAVASIFGDSENLEDFERRLNDPENRISNLDLNQDGNIDYLRVIENSSDQNSLVVIQAVLDDNIFQDVATIEVERVQNGNPRVQIIGDEYIYGSNYIIEPEFVGNPLIFSFFWSPRYSTWHSPYYWNNYPSWYSNYSPYSPFIYQRNVYAHINRNNQYNRTTNRNIPYSGENYNHIRRNDYASKYPDRSFSSRYQGVGNRNELIQRRSNRNGDYQRNNNIQRPTSRVRPESQNSGSNRIERNRSFNVQKSGSVQTPGREYNRSSNRNQPAYNQRQAPQQSESRSKNYNRRSAPENRSVSAPQRNQNRVESTRRSSVSSERSTNRSNRERSNNQVRSNSTNNQNSDSNQKESRESRRNR